ncbi:MAG: hypothetical protein ACXVZV_00530 [Terriglobales bacterium]
MKPANARLFPTLYTLILLGAAVVLAVAIGCSTASKANPVVVKPSQPIGPAIRPDAPKSVAFTAKPELVTVADNSSSQPKSKYIVFKSRDYGISLQYPWQYTKLSAKTIANNPELQPKPDGFEGQFTIARIDVPKGFYPDTDFDSAYLAVSLNQDISKENCESSLKIGKDAKPQTTNANGTDLLWTESDSGGKGSAAKIRNYVAYANDTCYEIETGVKTVNDGFSREVDPYQVMKRLDSMLMTVKIVPEGQPAVKQQLQSTKQDGTADSGK